MSRIKYSRWLLLSVFLVLGITLVCKAQSNTKPLTNDDIIKMVREKVDEDIILRAIRTSEINFDISPNGLIQLKNGKVKKQLIEEIQNVQLRKNNSRASSSDSNTRIRVIAGDPPQPTPTPTPRPTPTPIPTPVAIQDAQFFTFELDNCSISGTSAACFLTITNNAQDRRLLLDYWNSDLIDESGNEAHARFARLADKESAGSYVEHDIVAGATVKSWIRFENVAASAQRIARLRIGFIAYPGERGQLDFRNVPLAKSTKVAFDGSSSNDTEHIPETEDERRRREQQEAERRRKVQQQVDTIINTIKRRHY